MVHQKKLGVFWGDEGIELVEVQKNIPVLRTFIPFAALGQDLSNIQSISEDARLLELIQQNCRNAGFTAADAYLSFSSRDIIVRWFQLPFMKPQEIQGVVAFEARKYLPFAIEELVFNYYPSVISNLVPKQIGVLFVAIKRDVYQRCITVLSQSGLNVVYSEPSSMSLLRTLVFKRLVFSDHVVAIVLAGKVNSEIYIASQGVVRFVRDFSLSAQADGLSDGEDLFKLKLFSEIRISLDFYSRQDFGVDVDRIIAVDTSPDRTFFAGLSEELGIPVVSVQPSSLLPGMETAASGTLVCFGAALSGEAPSVIDLNLSESFLNKPSVSDSKAYKTNYFLLFFIAAFFYLILGLVWNAKNKEVKTREAEVAVLEESLGEYSEIPAEEIESRKIQTMKLLKAFKDIPFRSRITYALLDLFKLLPEMMWVDSLTMKYEKPAAGGRDSEGSGLPKIVLKPFLSLSIRGIADDPNSGFAMVNDFVVSARKNPDIKSVFKEIELGNVTTQMENKKAVVSFVLSLQ